MRHRALWTTLAFFGALACAGDLDGDESEYRASRAAPGDAATAAATTEGGAAGGGGGCDPDRILQRACALSGCHGASTSAGGLDLESPGRDDRLVDVSSTHADCPERVLVSSEDVERSLLTEKLRPGVPQCGDRMPIVGSLDAEELSCLESWVLTLSGAGTALPTGDAAP